MKQRSDENRKQKDNRKMGAAEWLLLIFATLCFVAAVYSTLYLERMTALIVNTGTAILLLCFAAVSKRRRSSENPKNAETVSEAEGENRPAEEAVTAGVDVNTTPEVRTEIITEVVTKETVKAVLFDEALLNDRSSVDLLKVTEDALKQMKPYADPCGIRMNLRCSEDEVILNANYKLLSIMLRNIIDNSIKYMQRAGQLLITITKVGDDVFIICKDDGMGITSSELPYIFELNFQGSNRVSGNGLGLAQARDIVNAYQGVIYAKSSRGAGMGIYIQLPVTQNLSQADS